MRTVKDHKSFSPETVAHNNGFKYRGLVPWNNHTAYRWNETCADVLEVFGLPGHKFTTSTQLDYMEFYFKSNRDAELCKVLLSEKI